jgi:hypothetical protein
MGQQRHTTTTLNVPDAEGSSANNLKNQHFMKKVALRHHFQ